MDIFDFTEIFIGNKARIDVSDAFPAPPCNQTWNEHGACAAQPGLMLAAAAKIG